MPRHREPTLAELVRGRAAEAPGTVAFVVDGGAPLTYADWERRSNAAALGLRDRQVGPGDRVVLWFDASRWADLAAAYAGVHKAGAVAVPLGSSLGAREVARVAAHCRAAAVVTGGPRAAFPGLPSVASEELEAGQDGGALEGGPGPADPVELAYRCGFLTRPEARARSAPEVLSVLAATDGPSAPQSTIHSFAPGTAAATDALWSPLRRGRGPVVVLPAFDPDRFCALAAEHAVERWSLAPATVLWLLQSGALDRHDPGPVGQVVLDGGRPSPSLLSRLGARLPGTSVISVIGPPGARVPFVFEPDRPSSVGRRLVPGSQPELPEGEGRRSEREAGRRSGVTAAPDGEVLDTIASIWERVLDRAGFGAGDDFFELGGDQLAAVEMQSLVEDALEVRLPPSVVFDAPTVSALAAAVGRARGPAGTGSPPPVPVAASQEGMIWHEQFAPGSQNLPPLVRRYRGPLDARVFETALGEIVRRHEPLRTTFELHEGRPVQVVAPPSPLSLPVRDLTDLPAGEQDDALAQALSDAGRPFDLVEGPLFEPTLLRLGGEDHIAVFRVHHSVYDDWSVSVFRRELSTLYAALASGDAPPLAELPVPFSTFARRQRRRLAGPAGTAQLRWWRDTLAGGPLGLELPIDDPDRAEGSPQPSAEPVSVDLPAELSAHLRALAGRQRATPFMTVLAAFEVLLHRYTGQTDVLLASVVANRNRTELEGMIGCFTKKILLRQEVAGDATFADVLARTRSVLLGALSNQDLAFETVVQEALGAPAASHGLVPSPVVMVQGVTPQADEVVLPGIVTSGYNTSATSRRRHFRGGRDDELPAAQPWGAGLYRGTFLILSVADRDDHVSLSARGAFHRPAVQRLLANFATLLADAVAHPFRAVSELAVVDPAERALVVGGARARPDESTDRCLHRLFEEEVARSPARLAVDSSSGRLTFAELSSRTDRLARRLGAAGVGPGTVVGVCLAASIDCLVSVVGVWKAGAAYVALDPDDRDGRLAAVLKEASPTAVLARPDVRPSALAGCRLVDVAASDFDGETPLGGPVDDPSPSEPAVIFYGAGASAVPDGVVLSHRSVAGLLAGLRRDVYPSPRLRIGLSAGPTEDGFLRQIVAVLAGHTLRLASPTELSAADVDVVDCTPEQFEALAPGLEGATVVIGSREPTRAPLGRPTVHHLYGPPECCFGAGLVQAGPGARLVLAPLAGVAPSVLDRAGQPAPIGVTGDLHLGRPDEPAGWRSGLLARHRPDGTIELVAKASDVVLLRGFAVDRAKLEAVLRRCPGVRQVRVTLDASEERLVAHVVPNGEHPPTLAGLRVHVWAELPGYAWPSEVVLDEPAVDVLPPAGTSTAGSGELPEADFLAALWAEVLGVDEVPVDANYWQRFSFLEVVSRARAAGVRLGDEQVTRNRTVATLAADMAAERLAAARKEPR